MAYIVNSQMIHVTNNMDTSITAHATTSSGGFSNRTIFPHTTVRIGTHDFIVKCVGISGAYRDSPQSVCVSPHANINVTVNSSGASICGSM